MITEFKKIINEEVKQVLAENAIVRKAIFESRLARITEALELDEDTFIDKARKWFRNKYYTADQSVRDKYRDDVLVNPKKITSDPASVEKILKKAIVNSQNKIRNFKSSTLKTSTEINNLQEEVFDLFGKFFNLLDSVPMEKRGLYEREIMRVVSVFYNVLEEERKRIEVYLSALAHEVSKQGYDLGKSAGEMARYRPEARPSVVGNRVVEPESNADNLSNLVGVGV